LPLQVSGYRRYRSPASKGLLEKTGGASAVISHEGREDAQAETLDVVAGEAVDPPDEIDHCLDLRTGDSSEPRVQAVQHRLDLRRRKVGEDATSPCLERGDQCGE
jgi:hypothetical protein